MRPAPRRFGPAALALCFALGATAPASAAARFTVPDPYAVPQSAPGVPNLAAVDISATGFAPHVPVYAELCDGVPPSSAQWNPHADCGPATAAVRADSAGTVDFKGANPNWQILIWHGSTPTNRQFGEQNFNCLAAEDNPNRVTTAHGNLPVDPGIPAWGSRQGGDRANPPGLKGSAPCQIRLTVYPGAYQPSDVFLPVNLTAGASAGGNAASSGAAGPSPGLITAIVIGSLIVAGEGAYLLRRRNRRATGSRPTTHEPPSTSRERLVRKG